MKKKTIEEQYVQLEHREQILLRPDTIIGSVVSDEKDLFVFDEIDNKIKIKSINYNPGFFKIFDEVLVNASDHYIRTGKVKYIKINIEKDNISIENDGPGIPVQIHKKEKVYVPEMVFGRLLTSENYDDTIERRWGGRNGIGAKSANIFSKKFIIETSDGKKKYYQEFSENMSLKTKPEIIKSSKNYTKITFYPDFSRFGLSEIVQETMSLMKRRCVDVAAYCSNIKVYFNGDLLPIKSFKDYMKMFDIKEDEIFYEKIDDNWEIGVTSSVDNNFNQVSLVNGISTYNGGSHVNVILNQITRGVQDILSKKYKNLNIKPADIKNRLFLFVNCKIINPSFDEQSKETLNTKILEQPKISDNLIKKIVSSNFITELIDYLHIKEHTDTKKQIGKHKIKISKLDDARKAGTYESDKCLLFLAEGDSASSSVLAGVSAVDDPEHFGVFPLRGKPLNVRDSDLSKVRENDEIKNIINILGLEYGKHYSDTSKLRYGKVVLMADADCIDGDSFVLTKRGYIQIKDVTYDDCVLTHNNRWKKIKNIIKTNKNKLIKLTINKEEYLFGENHELPILRGGEIVLEKAKNILKTDKILKRKSEF